STQIAGVCGPGGLRLKAARLGKAECGCSQGATIEVRKNIPIGAGLGGGSSDAATVLHALNELWGCKVPDRDLARMGLKLGADVPLFLKGRSAWAEGVGEKLSPVALGSNWFVLLMPGFRVATAEVFAAPGLPRNTQPIQWADYRYETSRNDCQGTAVNLHPQLGRIIDEVSEFGNWRMTGTGSAIFLPAQDEIHADTVTQELKCRYNVRAVRGVDRSPLLDMGIGDSLDGNYPDKNAPG
ncbi:MAG: 4-(cytidine 5'-diphospho)-2-C-methyl-D-erythritol kinase, partial [Xanthomonadales bacterium]|nr:4-(cytidine 5'-diphospho)-2-C-methyl-D-erythritol kinase [Xanthomonadales bacterium]